MVQAPPGADNLACWTTCETTVIGPQNEITGITGQGDGTFTLALRRPISAGGVTTITYQADGGASYTGTFTFHPANVNGDGLADADDVATLVACCLNQVCEPGLSPEEKPYRCDIDRSGNITPADMLRAIDLLNGGDQYAEWNNTSLPVADGVCP
jgi:hypothetical protein